MNISKSVASDRAQRGFTMIEMIGVLAVIAILASIVAPKIFDAIRDSKVNTFASNIQAVQTAVASFYKDVGVLPTVVGDLTSSSASGSSLTATQKKAWKGPYLDKNIQDMFSTISVGTVAFTSGAPSNTNNFDLDGDGVGDYTSKSKVLELNFPSLDAADAKAISGAVDSDSANDTSGQNGQWWNMGRFVIDTYTTTTKPTGQGTYHAFVAAQ